MPSGGVEPRLILRLHADLVLLVSRALQLSHSYSVFDFDFVDPQFDTLGRHKNTQINLKPRADFGWEVNENRINSKQLYSPTPKTPLRSIRSWLALTRSRDVAFCIESTLDASEPFTLSPNHALADARSDAEAGAEDWDAADAKSSADAGIEDCECAECGRRRTDEREEARLRVSTERRERERNARFDAVAGIEYWDAAEPDSSTDSGAEACECAECGRRREDEREKARLRVAAERLALRFPCARAGIMDADAPCHFLVVPLRQGLVKLEGGMSVEEKIVLISGR
ncbi:hypothetical protein DFH09DRAFT_1083628 [Mycena vulgaris]|nr:hypothetical protein DFH09DRAFT_1083628 [Mycena vulgaris]